VNCRLLSELECAGCSRPRRHDPDRPWTYRGSDGLWRCRDCHGGPLAGLRVVKEPTVHSLGVVADWQRAQRTRGTSPEERMTLGDRAKVR
jgi:hypothetical protein